MGLSTAYGVVARPASRLKSPHGPPCAERCGYFAVSPNPKGFVFGLAGRQTDHTPRNILSLGRRIIRIARRKGGVPQPLSRPFTTSLRGERPHLNQWQIGGCDNEIVSRHQGVDQDRDGEGENAGRESVLHARYFYPTISGRRSAPLSLHHSRCDGLIEQIEVAVGFC